MANFNRTEQQHEIKISAEAKQAISEFQKIANQFKNLEKDADKTSSKMEMFKGVLGAIAVGAMISITKQAIDAADAFNDMSARTGIAASALTSYQLAAKMAGTNVEDIGKGLSKLSKSMQAANTGSKESQQAFTSLGLSYLDTNGKLKTSEQMMLDVAAVFKTMPDGVFKTTAAMNLFGKSGTDLIPFLNMGKEGIAEMQKESEDLGITLSEKTLGSINDFNDALDKSSLISSNGLATIVSEYLPGLTELASVFNLTAGSILKTNDAQVGMNNTTTESVDVMAGFLTELGMVGDVFQALKNIVVILFELIKDYFVITGSLIARFAVAFDSLIKGDFKSATRAFDGFGEQLKNMYTDVGKTMDKQFTEDRFSNKIQASLLKARSVVKEETKNITTDFEGRNAELKKSQEVGIKILEDSIKKQEEIYKKAKSERDKSLEDTKNTTKEFDKLIKDAKKDPEADKKTNYEDVLNSINKTGALNYQGDSDAALQQARDTVDIIKQAYANGNLTEYDRNRFLETAKQDAIDASVAKEALAAKAESEALVKLDTLKAGKVELEKPINLSFNDEAVKTEAERVHELVQKTFSDKSIKLTNENALGAQPAGFNPAGYKDPAEANKGITSNIILNFPGGGQVGVSATADEAENLQNIVNRENLKAGL